MSNHAVITGTGRSGTSFIMELLTHLGVDTGFDAKNIQKHKYADAGMEVNVLESITPPYVVKDPSFSDYIDKVISRNDIALDHVFVVIRDLEAAAGSRMDVEKRTDKSLYKAGGVPGGLSGAVTVEGQQQVLLKRVFNLVLKLAATDCEVTLLSYPLLVKDPDYLFEKLSPILEGVTESKFLQVFNALADQSKVHRFSEQDIPPRYRRYRSEELVLQEDKSREVMAQVFFDLGSGYSEKDSFFVTHSLESDCLVIDLPENKSIRRLRFDPANEPCVIKLKKIAVEMNDGALVEVKDYRANGGKENALLFFLDNDPQIIIPLHGLNGAPVRLKINYEYLDIGRGVRERALPIIERDCKIKMARLKKSLGKVVKKRKLDGLKDWLLK